MMTVTDADGGGRRQVRPEVNPPSHPTETAVKEKRRGEDCSGSGERDRRWHGSGDAVVIPRYQQKFLLPQRIMDKLCIVGVH